LKLKNSYVAIIPARGGSKGLPRKNVLLLAGKPLIAHTISAALDSGVFSNVYVTTDCDEIKEVAFASGAQVIDRPKILATDSSSSLDVITHTLNTIELLTSHFILLQPTSPLRNAEHIVKSVQRFEEGDEITLVSVSECIDTPLKTLYLGSDGMMRPMRNWADLTTPRQILPKTFKPNGAIYISNCLSFLESNRLIDSLSVFFIMDARASFDVDNVDDFMRVQKVISE
jgi:N-acylneuraminate cytidylyltransferase/CMP-N,N'-diacetyllegionaminic acid synthase